MTNFSFNFGKQKSLHTESRLCRFADLNQANEILSAGNALQENPALKNALDTYLNSVELGRHPELQNPIDRSYFASLLVHSMVQNTIEYSAFSKLPVAAINPAFDAFNVPEENKKNPSSVGDYLKMEGNMPETHQKKLSKLADSAQIGNQYLARINNANIEFHAHGVMTDSIIRDITIDRYLDSKKQLNTALESAGVRPPTLEAQAGEMASRDMMSRQEYLNLLLLVWQGKINEVQEALKNRTSGVRTLLKDKQDTVEMKRLKSIYAGVSVNELGPEEALNTFNVTLGQRIRHEYIQSRQGRKSGPRSAQNINSLDSAATWDSTPASAYQFLNGRMPNTPSNVQFLSALNWYIQNNWPANSQDPQAYGMEANDVRAVLHTVSQSLLESEHAVRQTFEQRQKLRKELTGVEKIEETAANMWEYMKDIQSHPVGSAVMWFVAIMGIKTAWNTLKKDRNNFVNAGLFVGLGSVAYGLYTKHTKGEAWWDGAGDKVRTWFGKEKKLKPAEQTLPNYWAKELKMDGVREQACLSVLQEKNTGEVMDWYARMDQWGINTGGNAKNQPPLPENILRDSKGMRSRFGELSRQEVGMLFYNTLTKFFEDRGKEARKLNLSFPTKLEIKGDAALGYEYIREKYVTRKFFKKIVEGGILIGNIKINSDVIKQWDSHSEQLKTQLTPEQYQQVLLVRQGYIVDNETVDTKQWEMWNVFMLEANPEILRRMGAAEPANIVSRVWTSGQEFMDETFGPKRGVNNDPTTGNDVPAAVGGETSDAKGGVNDNNEKGRVDNAKPKKGVNNAEPKGGVDNADPAGKKDNAEPKGRVDNQDAKRGVPDQEVKGKIAPDAEGRVPGDAVGKNAEGAARNIAADAVGKNAAEAEGKKSADAVRGNPDAAEGKVSTEAVKGVSEAAQGNVAPDAEKGVGAEAEGKKAAESERDVAAESEGKKAAEAEKKDEEKSQPKNEVVEPANSNEERLRQLAQATGINKIEEKKNTDFAKVQEKIKASLAKLTPEQRALIQKHGEVQLYSYENHFTHVRKDLISVWIGENTTEEKVLSLWQEGLKEWEKKYKDEAKYTDHLNKFAKATGINEIEEDGNNDFAKVEAIVKASIAKLAPEQKALIQKKGSVELKSYESNTTYVDEDNILVRIGEKTTEEKVLSLWQEALKEWEKKYK